MTSLPSQTDQLEQDLAYIQAFAKDPQLSALQRQEAETAAVRFEAAIRFVEWANRCAKGNQIQNLWVGIPDDLIAFLAADVQSAQGESLLGQATNEAIAGWATDNHRLIDTAGLAAACECTVAVLGASLGEEICRRAQENETENGARIKRVVVEEDLRGELLYEVAEATAARLAVPQSVADKPFVCESRDEARSIALEHIWEEIHDYTEASPPVSSTKFLLALMQGGMNKVIDHARGRVRTVVQTNLRSRQVLEEGDAPLGEEGVDTLGLAGCVGLRAGGQRSPNLS